MGVFCLYRGRYNEQMNHTKSNIVPFAVAFVIAFQAFTIHNTKEAQKEQFFSHSPYHPGPRIGLKSRDITLATLYRLLGERVMRFKQPLKKITVKGV